MPRGPRRGASSERRIQRKVEKTLLATHGGYAGASLIETLETELLEAMIAHLQEKEEHEGLCCEEGPRKIARTRGRVSGLVTAVAIMRNVYTADDPQVIKSLEREFIRHARAEMSA